MLIIINRLELEIYLPNPLPFYSESCASLDNKIVLNIGRLTNDKRHDLLINLWAKSKAKELGWKLKIIGTGENRFKIEQQIMIESRAKCSLCLPTKEIEQEYLSASVLFLLQQQRDLG
jgi:glycosyltransferase involved in cell wall biosynthesis